MSRQLFGSLEICDLELQGSGERKLDPYNMLIPQRRVCLGRVTTLVQQQSVLCAAHHSEATILLVPSENVSRSTCSCRVVHTYHIK